MKRTDRVLVVNGLRETADVLRAVLEPRGLDVSRIRGDETESTIETDAPRVVVFHQEDDAAVETHPAAWSNVPRVIIRSDNSTENAQFFSTGRQQFLQKPFQYSELVHAIERLLDNAAA